MAKKKGVLLGKTVQDGSINEEKLDEELQSKFENVLTKEEIYTVTGNPPRPYESSLHLGKEAYAVMIGKDANTSSTGVALGCNSTMDWGSITDTEMNFLPVTVGNSTNQRRIMYVKDGKDDTDAATVGQMKSTVNGIIVQTAGTSQDKVMSQNAVVGLIFGDPISRSRVQIGANSSTSSSYPVAIGRDASATNSYCVAVGYKSIASALYTVAVGGNTTASASSAVALGYNSSATGTQAIALGYNSSVAVGYGISIGSTAICEVTGGIALGTNSKVVSSDSVSADSSAYGPVSFGSSTNSSIRRRIINLRNGVNSYDAVTVTQLNAAKSSSANLMSDMLEVIELMSGQTSPVAAMSASTASADTVENPLLSKLFQLKDRIKQEQEELENFELQQKEYYESVTKEDDNAE